MSSCPFMSPLILHESCRVHPSHLRPDRLIGLTLTGMEDLEEADWLCQCVVWMLLPLHSLRKLSAQPRAASGMAEVRCQPPQLAEELPQWRATSQADAGKPAFRNPLLPAMTSSSSPGLPATASKTEKWPPHSLNMAKGLSPLCSLE